MINRRVRRPCAELRGNRPRPRASARRRRRATLPEESGRRDRGAGDESRRFRIMFHRVAQRRAGVGVESVGKLERAECRVGPGDWQGSLLAAAGLQRTQQRLPRRFAQEREAGGLGLERRRRRGVRTTAASTRVNPPRARLAARGVVDRAISNSRWPVATRPPVVRSAQG